MDQLVAWISANPAEAAWTLFAILTAWVWVYYRVEPAIKRYVESTEARWDDVAFARIQATGAAVKYLVDLLAVLLPALAGPRPVLPTPPTTDAEKTK